MCRKIRKAIYNIKITTAIILISAVGLVTAVSLSGIGYYKIGVMQDNISSMYNTDVQNAQLGITMFSELDVIHGDVKNQLIDYNPRLDATISQNIDSFNNTVKSYGKKAINNEQKTSANNLIKVISSYSNSWNSINSQIKSNKTIDESAKALLTVNEKSTIDALTKLVSDNDINAEKTYFSSELTTQSAVEEFIVISMCCVVVLLIISVLVVVTIKKSAKKMIDTMEIVSSGKLDTYIDTAATNEFGIMNKALDKTVKSVSKMVSNIMEKTGSIIEEFKTLDAVAREMLIASKDVCSATQIMAEGSTSQTQDLMSIDKQFGAFSDELNSMANAVKDLAKSNNNIRRLTTTGEKEIHTLVDSSSKVSGSFTVFQEQFHKFSELITQVNSIVESITGIATKTKLLSLNASIEAARAGEQGKGFAVVANEVNKLSEQSKGSADEITKLISSISQATEGITKVAEEMGTELSNQQTNTNEIALSFKDILASLGSANSRIEMLNNSNNEILCEKDKLVDRVLNASGIAEEICDSSEEITASASQMDSYANKVVNTSQNLSNIVDETNSELNKFTV